ncbi:MAG: 30S ribosome-binding factor RbfA [Polyangiaceae bacterium]
MTTEVKRSRRVAESIREEMSLLLRGLSDPRLSGVLVTRVDVTDDLSFCRIYVRRDTGADEAERRTLLRGLDAAAGRLRRDLARKVVLRVSPALRFQYDEGIDAQQRVEELLREIETDKTRG